jgi:hypothetical protein
MNGGILQAVEGRPVAEVIEVASYPNSFKTVSWLDSVPVGTKLYVSPAGSYPTKVYRLRPDMAAATAFDLQAGAGR